MVSFIKDEEHKIIIRKIVGAISAQDGLDTFQTIVDMIHGGFDTIGIVNDAMEGKLNFSLTEIPKIAGFLKDNNPVFKNVRIAVCVNSPKTITVPLLLASQATKVNIKAFNSVDAAYRWILSYS